MRGRSQGRGELQLAVLVETLRREGFELTVGRPEVVTRQVGDGKLHEPVEASHDRLSRKSTWGCVTQLLALRKGRLRQTGEPRDRARAHGLHAVPVPRADRVPHRVPD